MHTPLWTDEHSQAISDAAPPVPDASVQELDRTWDAIHTILPVASAPRPRRMRVLVTAGLAAGALTVGGVAAASVWSAHTDTFPSDVEDVRLGGPGEYLDSSAPDYGSTITELTRDIPFPSDRARTIARQALVEDGQRDPADRARVSTGAMRLHTAQAAVCAWANEWAVATNKGDVSARAQATQVLDGAVVWPAVTDVDPNQVITFRKKTVTDAKTGRTVTKKIAVDNTEAGYLPLVRAAAHRKTVDAMGSVLSYWAGNCVPELLPDFPEALNVSNMRPDLPPARD